MKRACKIYCIMEDNYKRVPSNTAKDLKIIMR
jgi:hypothetical protein